LFNQNFQKKSQVGQNKSAARRESMKKVASGKVVPINCIVITSSDESSENEFSSRRPGLAQIPEEPSIEMCEEYFREVVANILVKSLLCINFQK
jgi:hypothetical protein